MRTNLCRHEPMPPVRVVWYDGGLRPQRPREFMDGDSIGSNGHILMGERGVISTNWRTWRLHPDKLAKEYGEPPKRLPRSPGHHREFINACKGGPAPGSNFDWAGPLTEAVLLGNVALRAELREDLTKTALLWDSDNLSFSNLPKANQFLKREYRKGWEI